MTRTNLRGADKHFCTYRLYHATSYTKTKSPMTDASQRKQNPLQLFAEIHYLQVGKVFAAQRLLETSVRDGQELHHLLLQYPDVQHPALEFHYACRKIIAARSESLIVDLVTNYTWRGIVWAAWLIALAPAKEYAKHLQLKVPEPNRWLVEFALHEVLSLEVGSASAVATSPYPSHQALLRTFREQVRVMNP